MDRTAMPKAAVDEHRQACTREHDVGGPPQAAQWATVNEIAEAQPMQDSTQSQLRSGVIARLLLPPPPCGS
jgi:hypothetical protein